MMTEEELIYILRRSVKFGLSKNPAKSAVAFRVWDAMEVALAPQQKDILICIYINGFSPIRVAADLNMPFRRVELLRRSALRFLLAALV